MRKYQNEEIKLMSLKILRNIAIACSKYAVSEICIQFKKGKKTAKENADCVISAYS